MTREEIARMLLEEPSDLKHHGVIGMKWGVRRYQNPDGSLTAEGRAKYGYKGMTRSQRKAQRASDKAAWKNRPSGYSATGKDMVKAMLGTYAGFFGGAIGTAYVRSVVNRPSTMAKIENTIGRNSAWVLQQTVNSKTVGNLAPIAGAFVGSTQSSKNSREATKDVFRPYAKKKYGGRRY